MSESRSKPSPPQATADMKVAEKIVLDWERMRGSTIGGSRYSATREKLVEGVAAALAEREREALERAAADWLELLKSVHKPHPQAEICAACVAILQRRPGDRAEGQEAK